jgi:hypothetical protein
VVLFPYALAGALVFLFVILPGMFVMWRLPTLAARDDLDLTMLALRAVDRENAVRPFFPLGYRAAVRERLIDLLPDRGWTNQALEELSIGYLKAKVTALSTTTSAGGPFQHRVQHNFGAPREIVSAAPHLNVSREEFAQARRGVTRLFDPKNKKQWAAVLEWGESLFWTEWISLHALDDVPKSLIPAPAGGSEDERLWLVWQVLRGDDAAADDELARLPQLFEQAFPSAPDRAAALGWAEGLYGRLDAEAREYKAWVKGQYPTGLGPSLRYAEEAAFKRVLPPRSDAVAAWLVYRYPGLSEASRAAARRHWLALFPPGAADRVEELGRSLEAERRAAGEPLPPVPETLPLLCVVERLDGSDGYGQRCRDGLRGQYPGRAIANLEYAIEAAYPNDEIFYLTASRDPLQLSGNNNPGTTWAIKLRRVASRVIAIFYLTLGVGLLLHSRMTARVQPASSRPLWYRHLAGRGGGPFWLAALSVGFFAGVGCLLAPSGLPPLIAVQVEPPGELFLGALVATAFGGMTIAICRRLAALFLVAFGVDVETTWADEILGVLAGGGVLFHFGNGLPAIALFALSDIVPGLLVVLLHRRGAHRREAVPVPA